MTFSCLSFDFFCPDNMRNRIGFFLFLLAVLLVQPGIAATITVTTTTESGPGSLRNAIAAATSGDTIDFSVTGAITLTSGELSISKNLVITGPGAGSLAVQRSAAAGTPEFRIFHVQPGVVGITSGLTIRNGRADNGGGILNEATFQLLDCVIADNSATTSGGGLNNLSTLTLSNCVIRGNSVAGLLSGTAFGGGLNNHGTLTNLSGILSSNSVTGGTGGGFGGGISSDDHGTILLTNSLIYGNVAAGGAGGEGGGGGFFNEGTLTIDTTTIALNTAVGGT